ncbi:pentraxin fusion protein-like [Xyrichtys novacula]|uniref:Pentraxin fusion protein-like n=1 Tax=Xyrichtys novacula TaxID=13765 RepID=A0AAV1FR31_XYRNO|nr:pentraxin fusion protein-like [Xyrichtys novacula]
MKRNIVVLLLPLLGICSAYTYKNVALRGKATQSHRYEHSFGSAYAAIDGNRDATFSAGSCTHTAQMTNPWWRLDLLDRYIITSIVITNRGDCCEERINGAEVRIGDSLQDNGVINPVCAVINVSAGATVEFQCNGMDGRFVNVVIPGKEEYLTLCEVEVYDKRYISVTENVALRGKATQSHRYDHSFGSAYAAIDGNRDATFSAGSCTHTAQMTNPWWRLDLLDRYIITSIVITNRGDCCEERINGAEVHIGDSLQDNGVINPVCAVINVSAGATVEFQCNGMDGRFVNVVIPGKEEYLTLCEVEVYGSVLD